ncbi:unnamed protein product [Urochloa decumbens]|uniref:Ubiquitin-like protease family profile domain-containing protein n=1 Tax=Urochloa decumbens TaxID=240449 RepID=A0ABC9F1Z2_9POAL
MVQRRTTPSTSATPPDRIKSRFSSHRFKKYLDSLDDVQKGFVQANGFGNLLNISEFSVPMDLLDWIMSHLIVGVSEFRCHDKSIKLTKLMIERIFGLPPPGNVAIDFDNIPENISSEAASASAVYATDQRKVSIAHVIELCKADHEESSFMRSFMLVALSCLLCPGTQNSVDLKYLNFLMRHTEIRDFDWSGHILQCILQSVRKFQKAIFSCDEKIRNGSFYYASCLPALSIIYMDFLDLHHDHVNGYQISYDVPRICHVTKDDFSFIVDVDIVRPNESSRPFFGALSFRDISATPYHVLPVQHFQANQDLQLPQPIEVDEEFQMPEAVQHVDEEVQHAQIPAAVPAFQDFLCNPTATTSIHHAQANTSGQVASSYQSIVDKHCNLLAEELPFLCSDVPDGTGVLAVFSSRLSMLASEIFSFAKSTTTTIGTCSSVDKENSSHDTLESAEHQGPEFAISTPTNTVFPDENIVAAMEVDPTFPKDNGNLNASSSHDEGMENVNIFSHCSDIDPNVQNGISIALAFAESTPAFHNVPHIELPNVPPAGDNGPSFHKDSTILNASSPHDDVMENINVSSLCAALNPLSVVESTPALTNVSHIKVANLQHADDKDHTGSSTIDRKKRKKRKAVILDDDSTLQLKIDSSFDEFYKKYVSCDFFQKKKVDSFVEISGFHCSYEFFRTSFKARGSVRGEVMTLYTKAFNFNYIDVKDTRSSRIKIAFPSFLSAKLLAVSPSLFSPESILVEINRINEKFGFRKADLLFFPICVAEHWSLICVNELQKQLHMFSSLPYPTGDERDLLITTLVSNFESACRVANIFDRPLSNYKKIFPDCPVQTNIFDCGIYVMMFMEFFDSKVLKRFDKVAVTQFRKIAAHRVAHSPLNDIDISLLSNE